VEKLKVKFYLDSDHVNDVLVGMPATIKDNSGQEYQGVISSVSQQPDEWSHRFLAEFSLEKDEGLRIGAVVDVKIKVTQTLSLESGFSWLPLSALTVGQSETKVLIYDNGLAREQVVTVLKVQGEMAQVKTGLAPEEIIIIDGNKLISSGQAVVLSE
jgi:hypothetical protein